MKWPLVTALSLLGLAGLAWMLNPNAPPLSWITLKFFHPGPWYYEMAVDLEVNGQPVRIDRVLECKAWFVHSANGWYTPGWYAGRFAVSQRLPDGSGVIVIAPQFCMSGKKPAGPYNPLVFWTPNATRLDTIEGYYDLSDAPQLDRHVRVKNVQFVLPSTKKPDKYKDDFADYYSFLRRTPPPEGKRVAYVSYQLYEVPRDSWNRDRDLVCAFNQGKKPVLIEGAARKAVVLNDDTIPPSDSSWLEGGWYPTSDFPSLESAHSKTLLRIKDAETFVIQDGEIAQIARSRGILIFQPEDTIRTAAHVRTITFELAGSQVDVPYDASAIQWFVCDPSQQRVFEIVRSNAQIYMR